MHSHEDINCNSDAHEAVNEKVAKYPVMDAPRRFLRESIHKKSVGKAGKFEFFEFPAFPLIFMKTFSHIRRE